MAERKVRVLFVAVGEQPMPVEIEATLEAQQALVGGLIQPLGDVPGLAWVVNEEGLLLDLPFNLTLEPWGDLVGPIYVARWDAEGEIQSVTEADHATVKAALLQGRPAR